MSDIMIVIVVIKYHNVIMIMIVVKTVCYACLFKLDTTFDEALISEIKATKSFTAIM